MLSLIHNTTSVSQPQFSSLEALLDEPFPRTPEGLLQLEQRLSTAAVQVADQIMLVQLTRAHEDEGFVRQAIAQGRARSPVPLVHKGCRTTSVLLLGGTCIVLETPYLREDRRDRQGRRRHKRGPHGAPEGPLAGKRARLSLDGGRVRPRRKRRGRKTAKGRHGFAVPWREPRVLVIDILDEQGQPERLRLPLYDVLIGDAEAIWALLIGYLRLLGAAYADVVEFIADGAEWIWKRVERLSTLAEIPAAKVVEVLDFYHASQYLSETLATCRTMPKAQRQTLYKRLRLALRHQTDGVEVVQEALRALATTHRSKAIPRALGYVETHAHRMRYVTLERRKLPIGSGQVESAVRRVVNLRFKAPGSFWRETTVSGLMHLRAAFKAGRWDEVMRGVLTDTFQVPSFEPVDNAVPQQSAAIQERETPQTFVTPRKKAA